MDRWFRAVWTNKTTGLQSMTHVLAAGAGDAKRQVRQREPNATGVVVTEVDDDFRPSED